MLRRGKKIDTVPREGATEQSLARMVVGRDVMLAVEKTPGKPEGPLLEVRGSARARRPRAREGLRAVAHGARGEIVALAGVDGNGQPELVEAITGMCAPERARSRSTVRTSPARACARRRMPASPTSPRTASAAGSCSRSRSPRTSRCASTDRRSSAGADGCASHHMKRARREAAGRVRRPRRRSRDATPRRCRAATSRRLRSRARSRPTPRCWSPTSRRAGSMSARSSSSTAG